MKFHKIVILAASLAFSGTLMAGVPVITKNIDFEIFEIPVAGYGPNLIVPNGGEAAGPEGAPVIDEGYVFTPGPDNSSGYNDLHFYNNKTTPTSTGGITVPWNETTVLGSHDDLVMTRQGGGAFTLFGFDYAGFANGSAFEGPIKLTGHLVGGGTVTTTFTPDGIIDGGPGGAVDFQRVLLGKGGWTNLLQVDFELQATFGTTQDLFAIDNVSVQDLAAVPEPSTVLMFGLGLLGLLGLVRRQRRS